MKLFKKTALAAAATLLLASTAAQAAGEASGQFQVKLNVLASCTVNAVTGTHDIDFGDKNTGASNLEQSQTTGISVTCTNGTDYDVALTPGNQNTGGAGEMTGPSDSKIAYQLKQAAGGAAANWGNEEGNNRLTSTGTGNAKLHTVHAVVTSVPTTARTGAHIDTVTVTVRW